MSALKAMGMTCGIGSMLIGARAAKFRVLANVEWRPYYHTGTFEHNFGAPMVKRVEDLDEKLLAKLVGVDLLMGHPECGNFSNLRTSGPKLDDPGDIPLFVKGVRRFEPRYFVMDDLPKSFIAYPMERWIEELSDYELFPEWISNYHYGNVQLNRRRFFMIGARRGEEFVFRPGEFEHDRLLRDAIDGLPTDRDLKKINHVHRRRDEIIPCGWAAHQLGIKRDGNKITYGELMDYIQDYPVGKSFQYLNKKGELKLRPGYSKIRIDHVAPVMTGGGSALDNHYREDTLYPLTARERARIQGCPDDFVFMPFDFMEDPRAYAAVYKQIGKFMPVEFCTYVARQISAHVRGVRFQSPDCRVIKPDPYVTEAKKTYCERVGYDRQEDACRACWIFPCELKRAPDWARQEPVSSTAPRAEKKTKISPRRRATRKQIERQKPSGKTLTNL
jgi:site-specific DNA-cytosine methylase